MSSANRPVVILVGDGMGDFPRPELGGLTPLEAADTPAMDRVASRGRLYRLRTVPEGMEPGSDVANLSLLGYRPEEFYTGRAPLEAASMGVGLADGEIAFRCNLVHLDFSGDRVRMVDYSAGHISTAEAGAIMATLEETLGGPAGHFHAGVGYRHLFVGPEPAGWPVTTPPHDHSGRDVADFWQGYMECGLGEMIREACALLADHPVNRARRDRGETTANAIWLWGEGPMPAMGRVPDLHSISGALISAVDLLRGIGVCAGLEVIDVPGVTGYLDTNYQGKVEAAVAAAGRHDLVFVHVEAPDETGHQGDCDLKVRAIGDFDRLVVAPVMAALEARGGPFRLVVAMDHYTPLSTQTHDPTPVPVAVCDRDDAGGAAVFSERAAAGAPLIGNGRDFFSLLFDRTGRRPAMEG